MRAPEPQAPPQGFAVNIDTEKLDRAALALLYLDLHEGSRTCKGLDWEVMRRVREKGYITDPVTKAKSVLFTEEGLRESQRLFQALFAR
ncbi:MAG: hypothetical protein JWM63_822 [Gammaproteobacteria bacterium]|jgi:hypothetical protein|nr:hypothetical protein [Gammaproteobacteria bacterium]